MPSPGLTLLEIDDPPRNVLDHGCASALLTGIEQARANAARSPARSAIEHVFAGQKHRMKLFIRTIGIARATMKIGMANLAYNFQRLAWLDAQTVSG